MDEIYLIVHPQGWQELMEEEKMTSGDYATALSIMKGKLNNVLNITNTVVTTMVPYVDSSSDPYLTIGAGGSWSKRGAAQDGADATDIRCVTMLAKSGVQMGTWRDPVMTVDRLPQKSNTIQLLLEEQCGAARTEDEKVVKILSDDTP
jgi:hypothetical protein